MCTRLERWIYLTRLAMKILKNNDYKANKGQKIPFHDNPKRLKKEYYKTMK